jgi:hypothetical protein
MSRQLDLLIVAAEPSAQADLVVAGRATLTPDFRIVPRPAGGHVAWICAERPDWADATATALAGDPAVVVIDCPEAPTAADLERLERLAADGIGHLATPVPLMLVTPHNFAAATTGFADQVRGLPVDWFEVLTVSPAGAEWRTMLFEALAFLEAAGLPADSLTNVTRGERAVMAEVRTGVVPGHVTCVRGPYPLEATIKAFGTFGSLEARTRDPRAGFPGEVVKVDAHGVALRPACHQAPHRLALIEAHALAVGSRDTQHLLSAYAGPVALLAATSEAGGQPVY